MTDKQLAEQSRAAAEFQRPSDGDRMLAAVLDDPAKLAEIPIETVERLIALRERMQAEAARRAYFDALARVQADIPPIPKTKVVPDKHGREKYRYAPLDKIEKIAGPVLRQHGFSFSYSTEQSEGGITAICRVHHADGHTESSPVYLPKISIIHANEGQNLSGTLTMAMRRAFCNAVGIVPEDDIDGGDGEPPPDDTPITAEQAANLRAMADEIPTFDETKFLAWVAKGAKVEKLGSIDEIPARVFDRVFRELDQRRKQS